MNKWALSAALGILVLVVILGVTTYFKQGKAIEEPPSQPPTMDQITKEGFQIPPRGDEDEAPEAQAEESADEAAPEELDSESARYFGLVLDAKTDEYIAGARILVRAGDEILVEASSDESGAFLFSMMVEYQGRPRIVDCLAAGYARIQKPLMDFEMATPGAEIRMEFLLHEGGVVAGTITDAATGEAIAGVNVQASDAQKGFLEVMATERDAMYSARTGEDGTYELANLSPGAYRIIPTPGELGYVFEIRDAVTLDIEGGDLREGVDFALKTGAIVRGSVKSPAGDPVPGATVELMPGNIMNAVLDGMESLMAMGGLSARTDEVGNYEIAGLQFEAEYRLHANAEGFASASSDSFQVQQGESPLGMDLVLTHGSTVSGTARYEDATLAKNQQIVLFPDFGAIFEGELVEPKSTTTNDLGAFVFEAVGAGTFSVFGGDIMSNIMPFANREQPTTVETDGVNPIAGLEVTLARADTGGSEGSDQGAIEGVVFDPGGMPAAKVTVAAKQVGGIPGMGRSAGATTADDGTFKLANLSGKYYGLSVKDDLGHGEVLNAAVGSKVTIRLSPPTRITGTVVDAEGVLVPECSVRLEAQDAPAETSFDLESLAKDLLGMEEGGQTTNADGFFEFKHVKAGDYIIKAKSRTKGSAESSVITVSAGQDRTGNRIQLSPGVTFSGVAEDAAGQALQGVTVSLSPTGGGGLGETIGQLLPGMMQKKEGTATSDSSGSFQMANIAPGQYSLNATHSDFAGTIHPGIQIAAGVDVAGFLVVMVVGGTAGGQIFVDGAPKAGAMIQLIGPGGIKMATADAEGRFDISGITPGSYIVQAVDMGAAMRGDLANATIGQQVLDIADGEAVDVDFSPPEGSVPVSGNLSGEFGNMTSITLRREGGPGPEEVDPMDFVAQIEFLRNLGGQAIVRADGSFQIEGVEPGTYILEVLSVDLDLSDPQAMANMMDMDRTPQIRQTVTIEEGQPAVFENLPMPETE